MAAGEELAVHGEDGTDAQGVSLAAPYGHPLVERGALSGLQVGRAEEVGDLAGHVEGDRQLPRRDGSTMPTTTSGRTSYAWPSPTPGRPKALICYAA
ncbi:hypothetical protein [Streptomyces agglomeratus]|nr:hypothetical protein [Streptomyces agglomeratus]